MHAPRPTLAQALRSGELVAALPRLVAFAAKRLGAAGACAEGPSGDEAEDVVQEAVVRCLEGGRSWPEGVSLEQFLLGVVRSVASRWRRRAERRLVVWLEIRASRAPRRPGATRRSPRGSSSRPSRTRSTAIRSSVCCSRSSRAAIPNPRTWRRRWGGPPSARRWSAVECKGGSPRRACTTVTRMNETNDKDPRETLRRLDAFLDEPLPTDEEARATCAAMGVDIPALADRICALVASYERGALMKKEEAPPSGVRARPARTLGAGRRVRR